MKVRDKQIEILQTDRTEDLVSEMLPLMMEAHPKNFSHLNAKERRDFIREGIEDAREHGLGSRESFQKYLSLACTYGLDFDLHSPFSLIFADYSLTPTEQLRVACLMDEDT